MVPSSSVPQAVLTFSLFRRPKDRHVNLQCRYLLSLHRVVRRIPKAGGIPRPHYPERMLSTYGPMQLTGEEPKCIVSEVSTILYRIEERILRLFFIAPTYKLQKLGIVSEKSTVQ